MVLVGLVAAGVTGLLAVVLNSINVPGPMASEPVRITNRMLVDIADPVALIHAATGRGTSHVFPVLH